MQLHRLLLFIALLFVFAGADEYSERACIRVFSVNINTLQENRNLDRNFIHADETCCCKDKILSLFQNRTIKENNRINPATDIMLKVLGEYEKTIRYTIKEVENLKQINAVYSMPEPIIMSPVNMEDNNFSSEGCRPIDFKNKEDRDAYLATIDRMENGGAGAGAYRLHGARSSAFGRYQIMPSTARNYCQRTPTEWNCCSVWRESPQCQDEMFRLLTIDNTRGLLNRGIPLNTCTVYIAHQQGLGGVYWIFGGNSPYSSITTLQNVVKANIGKGDWDRAIANGLNINDPDVLRKIYKDYWDRRFHADIANSEGTEMSPEDFQIESEEFIKYANKQKDLWREGIILELKHIKHSLKMRNK